MSFDSRDDMLVDIVIVGRTVGRWNWNRSSLQNVLSTLHSTKLLASTLLGLGGDPLMEPARNFHPVWKTFALFLGSVAHSWAALPEFSYEDWKSMFAP